MDDSGATHVRYVRLALRPARGLIHPVDDALAAASDVTRETLRYDGAHQNRTGVLFYQLRGNPAVLSEIFADRSDIIRYDTIDVLDGVFQLYLRIRFDESSGTLEECLFDRGLVIDPPVVFTSHNGLHMTVIGTAEMVQQAMECFPSEIACSVERVGQYAGGDQLLLSPLTDRQREVLETAFEMGYYEVPRRTTHQDIAAALDLSGSTVDEHLQKAECRLMEQILS
jgi:predicted DNA binding protein